MNTDLYVKNDDYATYLRKHVCLRPPVIAATIYEKRLDPLCFFPFVHNMGAGSKYTARGSSHFFMMQADGMNPVDESCLTAPQKPLCTHVVPSDIALLKLELLLPEDILAKFYPALDRDTIQWRGQGTPYEHDMATMCTWLALAQKRTVEVGQDVFVSKVLDQAIALEKAHHSKLIVCRSFFVDLPLSTQAQVSATLYDNALSQEKKALGQRRHLINIREYRQKT